MMLSCATDEVARTGLAFRQDTGFKPRQSSRACLHAVHDAQKMMERGLARRRTNETRMNAESSRSHAVLTLHLESSARTDLGLLAVKSSRLNLIDLAGILSDVCCRVRLNA